jgi:hypothetical protein
VAAKVSGCLSTVRLDPHHVVVKKTPEMRRVANAALLQFDRYDESPDSRTVRRPIQSPIFDHERM